MKCPLTPFGVLLLVGLGIQSLDAREWVIDGSIRLQADFAGVAGDVIFLKKADGTRVKYPLASISEEDRTFIRDTQKGSVSVVKVLTKTTAEVRRQPSTAMEKLLSGKLVVHGTRGLEDYSFGRTSADYVALYYSAGWCGPCHRFTPKLVEFYNDMRSRHANFEVIFVSNDRNEQQMFEYMRQMQMPWPAMRFADTKKTPEIMKYEGGGIPCLVVVDRDGKVVADSFSNGRYLGAETPMRELGDLLEGRR